MKTRRALFALAAYFFFACSGHVSAAVRAVEVQAVVDGDTIVVSGGEKIRYLGIDTPEFGEPFFEEAKEENRRLLVGKKVSIVECPRKKKDRYGRTLAWVFADGVFVNMRLLSEGLARSLVMPPCGPERASMIWSTEWEARRAGRGLWASFNMEAAKRRREALGWPVVEPERAGSFVGRKRAVRGRVLSIYRGPKALFLCFGPDRRKSFTVVVFSRYLPGFKDVDGLVGRIVTARGVITRFGRRAEIIAKEPWQIEPGP